jgi:hypothetical protein
MEHVVAQMVARNRAIGVDRARQYHRKFSRKAIQDRHPPELSSQSVLPVQIGKSFPASYSVCGIARSIGREQPHERLPSKERGILPRVLIVCEDPAFCEELRSSFNAQSGFVVYAEDTASVKAIKKAIKLIPDLVIVETAVLPNESLLIAEAIKRVLPNTPSFWSLSGIRRWTRKKLCPLGLMRYLRKSMISLHS